MGQVYPGLHRLVSPPVCRRFQQAAGVLRLGYRIPFPGLLVLGISLLGLLGLLGLPEILQAQSGAGNAAQHRPPLLEKARQLHRAGDLPAAVEAYRLFLATSPADEDAASAHNNLCLAHTSLGENQAALEDCLEAVRLRRSQTMDAPGSLARALNNLALVLLDLGHPGEAEPLLREALQLNRGLGDSFAMVQNLGNLGTLAIDTGNYSQAMDLFQEAQALAESHRDDGWASEQVAVARANQGVVLEHLGAFRQALDLYEPMVAATVLDPSRRAALRLNIAALYRNLGDPVRAVRELKTALAAFQELNDAGGESHAWLNLGLAYQLNLEQPAAAEEAYRKVLDLAGKGRQRQDQVDANDALGRLLLSQDRWEEAGGALQRGLKLARESDDPEGAWSCLEGLGRLALARGNLPEAAHSLEQAITTIEGQRGRLDAGLLRAGYFGGRRSAYEGAVSVYARLAQEGDPEAAGRALEIVQKAKSRELLESLTSSPTLPRPMTAREISSAGGDAFLLELFVADGRLYAWPLLPTGPSPGQDEEGNHASKMVDLGPAQPILEAAAAVHRRLSSGGLREDSLFDDHLESLSSRLLEPLEPAVWGIKRWMVSADRVLRYLPFEILPLADGSRLLEKATVSYLPSASSLPWLHREGAQAEIRFAGFASPRWQARTAGTALQADLLLRAASLRPLPEAEAELVRSAGFLGGRSSLHVGAAATEEAFRQAVENGARVVHLATHAVVRESLASRAAIVLSPSGDDDGLLLPEEITGLRAQVDLTILAACSTALDTAEDSRALASLTGSLLAAGSRAVLATLWDVGDQPTAAFMEQLYFRLGQGMQPAEALRETKLTFLADPQWQDPALWGAYILLGDPPRIVPPRSWPRWLLPLTIGISALWIALQVLRRRLHRG